MSNGEQAKSGDVIARYLAPGGDNVKLVYGLYLVSVLVGLTILIGLVMAYVNRGQVAGSWAESHYTYQIRTFWIGLLYSLLSVLLMIVGIGFLLIFAVLTGALRAASVACNGPARASLCQSRTPGSCEGFIRRGETALSAALQR